MKYYFQMRHNCIFKKDKVVDSKLNHKRPPMEAVLEGFI